MRIQKRKSFHNSQPGAEPPSHSTLDDWYPVLFSSSKQQILSAGQTYLSMPYLSCSCALGGEDAAQKEAVCALGQGASFNAIS